MFTASGDLYLIDFKKALFLPLSFMAYATMQRFGPCLAVGRRLDLPQQNYQGMRTAYGYFVMNTGYLGESWLAANLLESQLTVFFRTSFRRRASLRRRWCGRMVSPPAS